jgi:hypothetical protein
MIIDQERLVDGFRGLVGMDGSRDPSQIADGAASYAENCTFRGAGGPRTRPGFSQIRASYWRSPTSVASGQPGFDEWVQDGVSGPRLTGDTSTSASRFEAYVRAGRYYQGGLIYNDPREGRPAQLILVIDGRVLAIDLTAGSCFWVNQSVPILNTVPVYLVQAEKFVVIQDGANEPIIYDGYGCQPASYYGSPSVPSGKQMAYGQGRLFVAVNDGSEIMAGDLIYGGSVSSVAIKSTSVDFPCVVTTEAPHGFSAGDSVTITGHSSTPNINGTYVVVQRNDEYSFVIPAAVATAGAGGFVARFNSGSDQDLLNFSEHTFLAEGGSFSLPGEMGKVQTMAFVPVQDDATGQGDLIAFCERGAASFTVSLERMQWKQTKGFQRVLFLNVGSAAESVQAVNGDLFFRSLDGNGIRSYRSARADFEGYGQTPMSSEIDSILKYDTSYLLERVSFAYFDDRLLMTCWPRAVVPTASGSTKAVQDASAALLADAPVNIVYDGIAVLDFRNTAGNREKSAASFDGVWTGISPLQVFAAEVGGVRRMFAICFHTNFHELWEVSLDREHDIDGAGVVRPVNALVNTKSFDFKEEYNVKKLLRCDVWFDDLGGGPDETFECKIYWHADDSPQWVHWHTITQCFVTQFVPDGVSNNVPDYARGYISQFRLPTPPEADNAATELPANLGHEFALRISWRGRARLGRLLLHATKQTESVGGGSIL